ncbi:MAG: TolC family protein [Bacteroidales bacterium]|jgi:outer membrane protein|nr:TolC family protein [Bacteroidales bacterium]
MTSFKINPYIFSSFFLVLALSITSAIAQKVWTLEDCINYAFENNIQIKQSKLQIESVQADLKQSKFEYAPTLNGSSSLNYSWGRSIDPITNTYINSNTMSSSFGVNSGLTLFGGFQKFNVVKQNELAYSSSLYDSEKMANDIALQLTGAFLNILFNHEMLMVAQSQAEITLQQIERTKNLVEAGTLPQGDLLEIEAQGLMEEVNVIRADNNLSLSYLDLLQILDLSANEEFEIERPNISISEELSVIPSEQVYANAVNFMPEIKRAELDVLSTNRSVMIAKGAAYPSLSLRSGINTNYIDSKLVNFTDPNSQVAAFWDQMSDNISKYFTLSLNVPIFNAYQTTTRIKQAEILNLNSKFNLELTKNTLRKSIEQKYFDAIAAYKTYHANKATVKSLKEAFKYTEEKFSLGMLNSVEYNLAKSRLTQSESDLLRAKYDYIFKTKILDFYMGVPLKF